MVEYQNEINIQKDWSFWFLCYLYKVGDQLSHLFFNTVLFQLSFSNKHDEFSARNCGSYASSLRNHKV